jgi:N-terminal acetyltransferase B complex catalytic subunit
MALLEKVSEQFVLLCWIFFEFYLISITRKKTYFVDLFVRVSNKRAVDMYHKLNYVVYRRIIGYYSGERDEDAFGIIL